MSKERINSIYSMHTINMIFNKSDYIMVDMNLRKLEKQELVNCR